MVECYVFMKEFLVSAWENWDGADGKRQYKIIHATTQNKAHAEALEFAFTMLDPYMNEIKHYAEHMAANGYDYDEVLHNTMLECAHYDLWEKCLWDSVIYI